MKKIVLLGSTGSIGRQTLDVVAAKRDKFQITALAANSNDRLLAEQIEAFNPRIAVLADKAAADRLVHRYHGPTKILAGADGMVEAAVQDEAELVLTAVVGFAGLRPTLAAIEHKKDIALANKETLVAAGEIVMAAVRNNGVRLLPVDSEHSALFQCLDERQAHAAVQKLIITASGGPFRGFARSDLENVTVEACLNHPNWSMGRKITVDSATLVNKGLEVIEAHWLFNMPFDKISVLVHPQSIVHSLVEYVDGAVLAQLGMPDMRLPIQYALSYPERLPAAFSKLDLAASSALSFEKLDDEVFPALNRAYDIGRRGGTWPCVMNAANEIAVYSFLNGKLRFLEIMEIIDATIAAHNAVASPSIDDIFAADRWAREYASRLIARHP